MDTAATWEEDDEWELVNDEGFVYKRKRRSDLPSSSSSSVARPQAQLPDPTLELRFRREQKKLRLVKLKERYEREINQWEHLSNTLSSSIQQTSSAIQLQRKKKEAAQETNSGATEELNVSSIVPSSSDSTSCRRRRNLVDELISQAEAEEGIIENVEYLCEIGEGICSAKEESNKQALIQLPVWTWSPRELMKSLSAVDDDD